MLLSLCWLCSCLCTTNPVLLPPPLPLLSVACPPPAAAFHTKVWREGGYSDDLLLAAYCVENGLSIGMPASAVYPQLLPAATSFKQ